MNKEFHKYLKKAGEEISLTQAEREKMRSVIRSYMEIKPIRTPAVVFATSSMRWPFLLRPIAAALVVAMFVSTASVSYAAESALPGDILYLVKTRVNEPVKGVFAVSDSAKTEWAMDVAGERIREAATLASNGRLDTEIQRELQSNFEEHARQATENLGEQASTSPTQSNEAAVRFEAQLSEYERVLTQVGEDKGVEVSSLASSVRAEREHVVAVRTRTHKRTEEDEERPTTAEVSHMRNSARKQFDESTRLSHVISGELASSTAESVALQLENASATISEGEDFLGHDSSQRALDAFEDALSETEKLRVFLRTSSDIRKRTGHSIKRNERESGSKNLKQDNAERKDRDDRKSEGTRTKMRPEPSSAVQRANITCSFSFCFVANLWQT